MFVPIVPFVPHTTIINKTIVYSDTVLPLKDKGSNLIVTSINNISESSLERCLKTILESNPNVIFNTIQYSKNDKKVYFYTNKEITTKVYEESKFTKDKLITSKPEILEEVKRVLVSQKNKDNDCISLYDVILLLKKLKYEYDNVQKKYENYFNSLVKSKINKNSLVILYDFTHSNKKTHIIFRKFQYDSSDNIYFAKQNGDLYVVESESIWTNEVFSVLGSALSELYDELLKYTDYIDYSLSKDNVQSVNANFVVDISNDGVRIYVKNLEKESILFAPSYRNYYEYKFNSNIDYEAFKTNEDEILKRIFVKISDCPEWSQAMLYEMRQNQLAEEQKIDDELKYRQIRKQKRRELTRKIFPFLKK